MKNIHFFKEKVRFRLLHQDQLRKWFARIARHHQYQIGEVNFIFCSDSYLLQLNKKYLNHYYLTDIITFDNSSPGEKISGDIFISYHRVRENAALFKTSFKDELHRVMVHGILHLLGYRDQTKKEKKLMRAKENEWLDRRKF